MAEMLELPDQEFDTTMYNMLRVGIDKVDSSLEYMSSVSRNENPKKEQKRNTGDKNAITGMKNTFCGLIRETQLKKSNSELQYKAIEP